MKIKRVRHYVLRDYRPSESMSDATEAAGRDNEDAFNNAVAFTCLLPHPDGKLYCGNTCANTDILCRFDTETKCFESLHYNEIAEPFEVKVHRSLELASDGTIYGASAGLLGIDKRMKAPGGALFKLAPGADRPQKFTIPAEHDYIQTITLDEIERISI